jgi:AcrR family transcriptional regulator
MGRPRIHTSETEERLLAAAGRLIAAEGSNALTVRRLADEVGVSTRAVYSVFGDKRGLLRALFRRAATTMTRYHEAVPVRADPVEEIVELALAYRTGALAEADLYGLLYLGRELPDLAPDPDDIAVAYGSFDRVLSAVTRCAETGRLGGRDPRDVTRQLWALVHGLASLELLGLLGDPEAAARHWTDAVDAAMAGYGAGRAGE